MRSKVLRTLHAAKPSVMRLRRPDNELSGPPNGATQRVVGATQPAALTPESPVSPRRGRWGTGGPARRAARFPAPALAR